jgi:hypothetical protein
MKRRKIISLRPVIEFKVKNLKFYILSGICGVLIILNIFSTIDSSASGSEISALQKKAANLLNQRRELEQNLVTTLSVNKLQEQSTELGFIKLSTLVYVADTKPVAKLP